MDAEDRRRHRRLVLRLPITHLESSSLRVAGVGLWTSNVSAGGMYFQADAAKAPAEGAEMAFELTVPPGEGYSSYVGKIKGTGRVVRRVPLPAEKVGVGVEFCRQLSLEF